MTLLYKQARTGEGRCLSAPLLQQLYLSRKRAGLEGRSARLFRRGAKHYLHGCDAYLENICWDEITKPISDFLNPC